MKRPSSITFLGCGWLALPLATSLAARGYRVKATTTSDGKLSTFSRLGIDSYLVQFSEKEFPGNFDLTGDVLIISIPPGRNRPGGFDAFRSLIKWLEIKLPAARIPTVIFVSSTSVYADISGAVDENTETQPTSESARLILDAERVVLNGSKRSIILRMAGLIGPGRLPGGFFAGRSNVPNGLAPVNLVHRDDCLKFIETVMLNSEARGIYNVCAPSHPTKEEFYTLAAKVQSLPQPSFIREKASWKEIRSCRKPEEFEYGTSSLLDWLSQSSL